LRIANKQVQGRTVLSKRNNWTKQILPLTIIVIGIFFMLTQLVTNLDIYLKAQLTKVQYPPSYDFALYKHLLEKFVHEGLVNYKVLAQTKELDSAVDELASISPEHFADNNQKLAFWINTYNLLILKNVVNHYPMKERSSFIRDLSLRKFVIGGQSIATDDIRTGKIQPLISSGDPRPIFLICGGALGYPRLISHPISLETLESDMNEATNEFVNRKNNVVYEPRTGTLYISQFFKWNVSLFVGSPFEFVNQHLPKARQVDFDDFHTKTSYLGLFDWTLNEGHAQ